jgi:tartrate-resistant acid phosphatase type 5
MRPTLPLLALGLASCEPKIDAPGTSTSGTVPSDPSTSTPVPEPEPTGTSTPGSDEEPVEGEVIRFVALGDAGRGNDAQYAVGDAIATVCADLGCDFALYLGDNFYDTGVSSVNDEQFETKFELPYEGVDFPFYAVIGNHDLGLEGIGLEFWKAPYYVEYTQYSTKWTMPDTHYYAQWGSLALYGLNTTDIFFGLGGDQEDWLLDAYTDTPPDTQWRIAFGHHPYLSNGPHGDAGYYEDIPDWVPLTEIPRGEYLQEFFEDYVCGQVDLYISGHDHSRQWLEPSCGTTFVVTGAGSETTPLEGDNDTLFEDDTIEGFLWIELTEDELTARFFDKNGVEDFSTSFTR